MDTVFWAVHLQKDCFPPNQSLPYDRADSIRESVKELVDFSRNQGSTLLHSVLEHKPEANVFSDDPDYETTFPSHCLEGDDGAHPISELQSPASIRLNSVDNLETTPDDPDEPLHLEVPHQQPDPWSNTSLAELVERLDPFQFALFGNGLDLGIKRIVEELVEQKHQVTVVEDATCALNESNRSSILLDLKNYGVQVIGLEEATTGYIL